MSVASHMLISEWWKSIHPIFFGWENCPSGQHFGPAIRQYYLLHYVIKGKGRFQAQGQEYSLKKGDIFVIHPGEVTTYMADELQPWKYVWFSFHCPSPLPFLEAPVISGAPVESLFLQLTEERAPDRPEGHIYSLIYEILSELSTQTSNLCQEDNENLYACHAKTFLDSTFMQPIQIQQIADSLHINRRYLTALFRRAYGQTPKAYLTMLRLNHVQELLQQGYRITEAAAMAGFRDFSNFSKQYKAAFNVSPTHKRNEHL